MTSNQIYRLRQKRYIGLLFIISIQVFSNVSVLADNTEGINPDQELVVSFSNNRLSIRANDIPLRKVLDRLHEVVGIQYKVNPTIESTLNITISDKSLYEAHKLLLREYSWIMDLGADRNKINKVWILRTYERQSDFEHLPGNAKNIDNYFAEQKMQLLEIRKMFTKRDALTVDKLIKLARNHKNGAVRAAAIIGLSGKRTDDSDKVIKDALNDKNTFVRSQALQIIGYTWGKDGIEYLKEVKSKHSLPQMRQQINLMLGYLEKSIK